MGSSKSKKKSSKNKRSDPKDGTCKDCCQICGRLLLLVVGILALVFSLLVVTSCDFVEFAVSTSPDDTPTDLTSTVQFSFGQFRYQANNSECLRIADNEEINTDWTFWTGRISTGVAFICAATCCLIILVEFICCRFKFSRCLMATFFSIAIFGEALSFLMFASDVCTSENAEGRRYPCQAGTGSWYAVTAIALCFIASLASCFAPRPKPMIKRLGEDDNDSCLCCGGKKKDDKEESKKADEEQPTPPSVQEPPEPVPVPLEEPPITPVVAAGAAAGAAAATAVATSSQTSPQKEVPLSHVYTPNEDETSQVSSINHPSNVSAMTMPTTAFPTVSIYDGDMFFDSGDGANSV